MSFILEFITNLYNYDNDKLITNDIIDNDKNDIENYNISFVSEDILKSVNLKPVKDIQPNPARNVPPNFSKVDLRNLNKAQLNAILSVKLKPTPINDKIRVYEPRHPCLKELLNKTSKIY